MATLILGLAPGKNGYFDPMTNFYLTLDKPVQTLTYTDPLKLEKIAHALLASVPALKLYQGTLPPEAIDAWKAKYNKMFHTPKVKDIVVNGKVIGSVPNADPIRNGMDRLGHTIEGNRAFDRADEAAGIVGASVGEVEQVNLFEAESVEDLSEVVEIKEDSIEAVEEPSEIVEESPVEKKKTTRAKRD
jgi:hypothetical protein